jgi:hypothetical protein
MSQELPPCGLYRTTKPIGEIEAGRLVYFHNHGNPGAGLYFPEKWTHNRAHFTPNGMTLPSPADAKSLMPLPPEGYYRVSAAFFCCAKNCTKFEPDMMVQLGYNGAGAALLFLPELGNGVIGVPERGTLIDDKALGSLVLLKLNERKATEGEGLSLPRGIMVH